MKGDTTQKHSCYRTGCQLLVKFHEVRDMATSLGRLSDRTEASNYWSNFLDGYIAGKPCGVGA
jgi:hypothetical protein